MMANRISRAEARVLAEEEFTRFADLVATLTPEEWATPTDCTGWDVRKMVLHVLGSGEAQASVREFVHQLRRGIPLNKQIDSHHWVDGMNEFQIRERNHLSNDEIVAEVAAVGPRAVKGRWRTPPPARYLPLPFGPPIGWAPLKYLLDVGFTRESGLTGSMSTWHSSARCNSRPLTMAALSQTLWPSGPISMANPLSSCSMAQLAGTSSRVSAAIASRSTRWILSAPCPAGCLAWESSVTPSLCKFWYQAVPKAHTPKWARHWTEDLPTSTGSSSGDPVPRP